MNGRTRFLLTVSILGAANLSCHGPANAALDPMIAAELARPGPAQSSLDTEIPKTEIDTTVSESNRDPESRIEKMRYDKEQFLLAGLAASFL